MRVRGSGFGFGFGCPHARRRTQAFQHVAGVAHTNYICPLSRPYLAHISPISRQAFQHVAGVGHTNYISYCLMNDKGWAGGGIKAWRAEM